MRKFPPLAPEFETVLINDNNNRQVLKTSEENLQVQNE
jgi:hypothetical protein